MASGSSSQQGLEVSHHGKHGVVHEGWVGLKAAAGGVEAGEEGSARPKPRGAVHGEVAVERGREALLVHPTHTLQGVEHVVRQGCPAGRTLQTGPVALPCTVMMYLS